MRKGWCALIIIGVILADQLSKYWASVALTPYQPVYVFPFMDLILAYNKGAAFSFLSTTGLLARLFFPLFSLVLSVVLFVWLRRTHTHARLQLVALSLVLAGAVGNLIDRALWGQVVDFILLHYKQWNWPVFNLADMAISLGAVLLVFDLYQKPGSESR